ncbi:MAG: D-alanyl-D-alanine carboxypeptidase/D-alanyl-D-alanine-endopeptidase [Bacteroidetes bacterium]|nr:D-alanyl-D-alanine carboxypeptidase/D-alanyl-D-alanine-endopeptidase [Bacteroidota bacterium]
MMFHKIALITCTALMAGNLGGPSATQVGREIANRHPESVLGFCVLNSKGAVLHAYQAQLNLAPASSLKAITTATALEVLGDDFRFTTELYHSGIIEKGVLHGDLYVKPGGDPTWGSRYFTATDTLIMFNDWINQLKNMGINQVEGALRMLPMPGDTRHRIPPTWSYLDLGNYYGASLAPLNYADNSIWLTFNTAEAGGLSTLVSYRPWVPHLQFENHVVAARIGYDNAYVYGGPGQYGRWIGGALPEHRKGFVIKASLPEPEFPALRGAYLAIQKAGIALSQGMGTSSPVLPASTDLHLVGEIVGPKLADIVKITNMESNNLFAEALLSQIGLVKKGEWGTQAGVDALKEYWKEKGIDMDMCNLYDGSGLSRFNGIGAETMCRVLLYMANKSGPQTFYASLPVAGISGSIASMFKGTLAEGNLRAKSGYMDKVRSYSGYLVNNQGDKLTFCAMANSYSCSATDMRKELENWMVSLYN